MLRVENSPFPGHAWYPSGIMVTKKSKTSSATEPVYDRQYPVRRVLELVGDKWTPIVLYCLSRGTRRFSELQHQIPDISKKMLIQVLRRLETDGIVKRKVYPVVPPKTEYSLTPLGRKIHEPIALLCDWALSHEADLDAVARHRARTAVDG
ncbi:MAG: helix-turn-helix domain-containing protein [Pseudomonadota bacterium]